jgi:hypothetical protein
MVDLILGLGALLATVKILWLQGQVQTLKTRVDAAYAALERQRGHMDRLTRRVEELEEKVMTHGTR